MTTCTTCDIVTLFTIQEDTNFPFFRLEDLEFFEALILRKYLKYRVDSKGFELVDMSFEGSTYPGYMVI